jgi:chromosome segregation ATPase
MVELKEKVPSILHDDRGHPMKPVQILMGCMALWLASPAWATMYQYVDKQGITHYTNELTDVPADRRSDITEYPEVQTEPLPESVLRSLHKTEAEVRAAQQQAARQATLQKSRNLRIKELKHKKAALNTEYQKLLKEKSALENNKSFQARKNRYKYRHRPYIVAMVEREQQIEKRLVEIEAKMKQIDTQIQSASH